jgi:hypothetical protein
MAKLPKTVSRSSRKKHNKRKHKSKMEDIYQTNYEDITPEMIRRRKQAKLIWKKNKFGYRLRTGKL